MTLTNEQAAAARAPMVPTLVQAGAGTGKTFVMAKRVEWLVSEGGFKPESILGLTFTNKAANELAERVAGNALVLTYNAFAQRIVSEFGVLIGVEPNAQLLADVSRYQLAARVALKSDLPLEDLALSKRQVVTHLIGLDDTLASHGVSTNTLRRQDEKILEALRERGRGNKEEARVLKTVQQRMVLSELVDEFREAKIRRSVIDFSDQIRLAQEVVTTNSLAVTALRARHRVVLLDEYQDTSVAQRQLLVACFGDSHPLTAVGDPLQSIYEWRAASSANLTEFPSHFKKADGAPAESYPISVNFRSGQKILDAANRISEPLREIYSNSVVLASTPERTQEGEVQVKYAMTWPKEVEWVRENCQHVIAAGTDPSEIAILVRRGQEVPDLFTALHSSGIPVAVAGSSELIALPEVAELIAMLNVIDDSSDNVSITRLLGGPRWGLSLRDLSLLGGRAEQLVADKSERGETTLVSELAEAVADRDPSDLVSLSDAAADPGDLPYGRGVKEALARFSAELALLRKRSSDGLADLLNAVMLTTGYDIELRSDPVSYSLRRYQNVMAFRDLVEQFTSLDGESSLRGVLAWLSASSEWDEQTRISLAPTPGAVTIMTVHSAKGLEREVIFVPALVDEVFPSSRSRARWTTNPSQIPHVLRGDSTHIPADPDWSSGLTTTALESFRERMKEQALIEERRLAYVAVTRAKKQLFASGHVWGSHVKKPRVPSAYLSELAEAAEAGAGAIAGWALQPSPDATNPLLALSRSAIWPLPVNEQRQRRLREAATLVDSLMREADPTLKQHDEQSQGLLRAAREMIAEAKAAMSTQRVVSLPASLSVSQVSALNKDPDQFAVNLYRPMPIAPSPAKRRGTEFHAWVEDHYRVSALVEPLDLPGAADSQIGTDSQLEAVKAGFLKSRWAELSPVQLEWDFLISIAGRAIAGRADAVFKIDGRYTIVDWKTGSAEFVDPSQLSLYRHAWANTHSLRAEEVDALFVFLPDANELRPESLLSLDEIAHLLGSGLGGAKAG